MAFEGDIRTALLPLAPNRVFPDFAPNSALSAPVQPFITYQQVGGDAVNFYSGVPDKFIARVQINAWAATRIAASALIRQVDMTMRTTLHADAIGGPVSIYEDDVSIYGARQDFYVQGSY